MAYLTANGGQPAEVYTVDRTNPNVVTRMREALGAGETTAAFAVARNAMTGVVVVDSAGGTQTFYSVDLAAPGSSVRFASPGAVGANPQYTLSDDGNWFAYLKDAPAPGGAGTIKQLHLASTHFPDMDLTIGNTSDFKFRPLP